MPNISGIFVLDLSKLDMSEQEAAIISTAIVTAAWLEISKFDRSRARAVDLAMLKDPLGGSRGFDGVAGAVINV